MSLTPVFRPFCPQLGPSRCVRVRCPRRRRDRCPRPDGLERLARYGLRAPFALSRAAHGRLSYELKHPLDDATTHLVFEPLELLENSRCWSRRRGESDDYHGVLAPCASLRDQVVPPTPPAPPGACSGKKGRPPRRIDGAALLKRVFAVEILACALCGGRMRVLSVIEEGPVARKILDHLGLPSVARASRGILIPRLAVPER